MNRRELFLAAAALVAAPTLSKANQPRNLLDYSLTERDEFGMVFRRTVSADKINERFVSRAILLPDKSLKVISYDMIILDDGYFKFRRDSKLNYVMVETTVLAGL